MQSRHSESKMGSGRQRGRQTPLVQRDRVSGPMTDPAGSAVLAAFDAAQDAGLPAVDCYRVGVEAWRHSHPNQTAAYAGSQAVAIILAARISLRVDDA